MPGVHCSGQLVLPFSYLGARLQLMGRFVAFVSGGGQITNHEQNDLLDLSASFILRGPRS
jgi:hypothetical protein